MESLQSAIEMLLLNLIRGRPEIVMTGLHPDKSPLWKYLKQKRLSELG